MRNLELDVSSLSVEQRALLELRLKKKRASGSRPQSIPRRADSIASPLSFAQQRLWFLSQLEPESPFYNGGAAVWLKGRLDAGALKLSLGEILRRHEILRTTFPEIEGQPVQIVGPVAPQNLPLLDLSARFDAEREAEVMRLAAEEVRRPFDLARGPLLRTLLLRLDEEEHVLFVAMHHIICDRWSINIFLQELVACYEAFAADRTPQLPPLPIQYADFTHWQRQWLQGEVLERQLSFWKEQLAGAPPLLELPLDGRRPAVQNFLGGKSSFLIPLAAYEELKALGQREGVTLFMTLLAAFKTLLYRYTSQPDIVIGSPIAGRNRAETGGLIGFFVNTLALRTKLAGLQTFRQLLRRVKEVCLGAYAHQDLPFEKLVEELQPERSLSRTPLFQVMFGLINVPEIKALRLQGLTFGIRDVEVSTAKFDLEIYLSESPDGLTGYCEYSTDLFDEPTIKRLLDHYITLLKGVAADPDSTLLELPLLSQAERRQLLFEWNDTAAAYPEDQCLHQLFEAQARRTPEAVAVASGGERLTYDELNRRANRLARHLITEGLGPEVIVGVLAERGSDLLTAMLAIFKAGGAYMPLDPLHPAGRLAQVIEQSQTPHVLVADSLSVGAAQALESLPADAARPRVHSLEELLRREQSEEDPTARNVPHNLAYVIYTSGSTGRPKGAMIEHRGMLNHVYAKISDLQLTRLDVVAQTASQCFDISVWQFLTPLVLGGRVQVIPDEIAHDPARLMSEVEREGVTVLETVPSLLRAILEQHDTPGAARGDRLSALRWLVVTGEALDAELCRQWLGLYPRVPLVNAYGPTECSDDVTHHLIEQSPSADVAQMPIGRAVSNMRLYALDERQGLVPAGVWGELYVGGVGVGRGYLHDAPRTVEAFVPDPFSGERGARLYKTGDLGRRRADGTIEFFGRVDYQVKVRGFRIEPGEIEAVLASLGGVRAAVVTADEDAGAEKRLVAYVVAERDAGPRTSKLREQVRQRLPEYMVPSVFVYLDELPLTANGKVDRRRLPAPGPMREDEPGAYVAPRTATEQRVADIWAKVLKLERVGVLDNFFELGGHSLLATQVISRLRSLFEIELPLRAIFEHPTIAGLAARIESALTSEQRPNRAPIRPVSRGGELPLSFAQQRLWFLDQLEPSNPFYNIAAAIRLTGSLDASALEAALGEVVRRHEVLRTTFAATNGRPRQVISQAQPLRLTTVDLGELDEEAAARETLRLAEAEAQRPFDLSLGPLLRACLLRLSDEEHVMLFTMHHIISDGWSVGLLIREVSVLYEAYGRGARSPLAELPIQYADFAVWQREWLQSGALREQLDYWREHLAGAPPVLEFPTAWTRAAAQSFRGSSVPVTISPRLSEALSVLSLEAGATLFMTLLAAWQVMLWHHSGQEEIVVGTPIANRNSGEIEELIGFFVNTLVLRTSLRGELSFSELLGRVREVTLGAYAHQDVPFEMLVEELQPARSLSHSPLFQVAFVFQNVPQPVVGLTGLSWAPLEVDRVTVKHDLKLDLTEGPEGLRGAIEYRADLFEAATIKGWVEQLLMILNRIVERPGVTLATLALMLAEADSRLRSSREREFREVSSHKLKNTRRKVIGG